MELTEKFATLKQERVLLEETLEKEKALLKVGKEQALLKAKVAKAELELAQPMEEELAADKKKKDTEVATAVVTEEKAEDEPTLKRSAVEAEEATDVKVEPPSKKRSIEVEVEENSEETEAARTTEAKESKKVEPPMKKQAIEVSVEEKEENEVAEAAETEEKPQAVEAAVETKEEVEVAEAIEVAVEENKELETEEVSMESEDVPKPEIESQLADVAAAQEPENAASPIKSQDVIYSPSFYTHMVSQSAIPVHSAETPLQIASPVESPQVAVAKGEEKAETETELAEKAYDRASFEAFVDAEENMEHYKGETPLYRAALNGNTEIVKMLLDAGADPNGEESMETEVVPKPEESSQATNLAAVVPEPTSPVKSEAESAKEEDNKA